MSIWLPICRGDMSLRKLFWAGPCMHLRTFLLKLNKKFRDYRHSVANITRPENCLCFCSSFPSPRVWQRGKVVAMTAQVAFRGALRTAEYFAKLC